MEFSLHAVFWAGVLLAGLLLISQVIRQNTPVFRRIFLPSAIIAGTRFPCPRPQTAERP